MPDMNFDHQISLLVAGRCEFNLLCGTAYMDKFLPLNAYAGRILIIESACLWLEAVMPLNISMKDYAFVLLAGTSLGQKLP